MTGRCRSNCGEWMGDLMADVRVKLKLRGINQLMSSAPVQSMVNERGRRIAAAAGNGVEYVPRPHKWTARGFVQTVTRAAAAAEARDKTLTRSLDAGR